MNDIQLYQFQTEWTLEEEDDSDCFEESGIVDETSRITGNTDWCLCELCVNQWIPRRNLFVAILCQISTVFQMWIVFSNTQHGWDINAQEQL